MFSTKSLLIATLLLLCGCNFQKESPLDVEAARLSPNDLEVPVLAADQITFRLIQTKVFARSCMGCHSAPKTVGGRGNAGGINLETYLSVFLNRALIRRVVAEKTMPPEKSKDLALSAAQSEFLIKWIDSGAREEIGKEPVVIPPFVGIPFFRDVNDRVLVPSCIRCHTPEKLSKAKVALETYENVFAARADIKSEVVKGFMPPKKHAMPLTEEQKKILLDWIDQGAKLNEESEILPPAAPPVSADPLEIGSPLFRSVMEKVIKPNCIGCHSLEGGNRHDVNRKV